MCSVGQTCGLGLPGLKPRCQQGLRPSWRRLGRSPSPASSRVRGAPAPWLPAPSCIFQACSEASPRCRSRHPVSSGLPPPLLSARALVQSPLQRVAERGDVDISGSLTPLAADGTDSGCEAPPGCPAAGAEPTSARARGPAACPRQGPPAEARDSRVPARWPR